jgi:hypothetical protein
MFEILLLLFLYSFIWFVPISINHTRRKQGKPPYWLVFGGAILLEIGVVVLFLYLGRSSKYGFLAATSGPIIASILAATFYIFLARSLDAKST